VSTSVSLVSKKRRLDPTLALRPAKGPLGWISSFLPKSIMARGFLALVVALIPVWLVVAGTYYRKFEEARRREVRHNMELARVVASGFESYVQGVFRQEQTLGTALFRGMPPSTEEANRLLAASAHDYPSVRAFAWLDHQGQVVASSETDLMNLDLGAIHEFREAASGRQQAVSDIMLSPVIRDPIFAVSQGILDDAGALRGSVVALVDPGRLNEVLKVDRSGMGSIAIFDRRGWAVYHYPELTMSWEQRKWIGSEPDIAQALSGKEVSASYESVLDGRTWTSSFSPMSNIGWAASAGRPDEEVMAPLVGELARDSAVLVMVGMVALFVAAAIGGSITGPIMRLEKLAMNIRQGELRHRVQVAGPKELGRLAGAFNQMAEEIQSQQQQLQAQNKGLTEANDWLIKVHRALSESEERYRTIGELIPFGVWMCEPDGKIQHLSSSYLDMLGLTFEEYKRLGWPRLLWPEDRERAVSNWRRCISGGNFWDQEFRIRAKNGSYQTILSRGMPIRDEEGVIVSWVGINLDITERKQAEQVREEYISLISHDLRNPLTIILGHAQVLQRALRKAGMEGREERSAEAIVTTAWRVNAMIKDLVDSARLESGKLQLQVQPVEIDSFVSSLLERFRAVKDFQRTRLEMPSGLPLVMADPDRLERILANLLTNALKYSPPEKEVLLRAERRNSEVVVSVTDQGFGIPAEDLPNIFDRFYRATGAQRAEGLGLGLYITRMLVEAHGGRIWVESEVGRGTTFYFSLPMAT